MKTKNFGSALIWFFSLLTIMIWVFVRSGTPMFLDYETSTHSLGQITGLVGMVLFALTFVLTTRLKFIENLFGGLDKMYVAHHFIGALSFILILFHPLLLVIKFVPTNIPLAAKYLLPSSSWPVNFGIIALLAMIILLVLTFYIKLKYQTWKASHKLLGIAFLLAIIHIFTVTTDISRYSLLKFYMIFMVTLGTVSYFYGSFFRHLGEKKLYCIEKISSLNEINILELKPVYKGIKFKPGQFIFVKFKNEKLGKEQHPFTIASSPTKKNITLMIKDLGDFTSDLKKLKEGTVVEVEGPYGHFGSKDLTKERVWIAGGIGITPFASFIEYLQDTKKPTEKIDLYYSVKKPSEAFLLKTLNQRAKVIPNLNIYPIYTEKEGYLSAEKIEKISGKLEKKVFLFCGPMQMTENLVKQLIKKGVPKRNIIFEKFNIK